MDRTTTVDSISTRRLENVELRDAGKGIRFRSGNSLVQQVTIFFLLGDECTLLHFLPSQQHDYIFLLLFRHPLFYFLQRYSRFRSSIFLQLYDKERVHTSFNTHPKNKKTPKKRCISLLTAALLCTAIVLCYT